MSTTSSKLRWMVGDSEVSLFSPSSNTIETSNDLVIDGDLLVAKDMSVDGIIYASVNVNPGFIRTTLGIPGALTTNTSRFFVHGDVSVRLGRDGKAFILYSYTEGTGSLLATEAQYIGVVHCFDMGCTINRKYRYAGTPFPSILFQSNAWVS